MINSMTDKCPRLTGHLALKWQGLLKSCIIEQAMTGLKTESRQFSVLGIYMPCPLTQGLEHIGSSSSHFVVSNFNHILFPQPAPPHPSRSQVATGGGAAEKQKSIDSYPEVRSSQVPGMHSSQETRHQGCQGNLKY